MQALSDNSVKQDKLPIKETSNRHKLTPLIIPAFPHINFKAKKKFSNRNTF